MSYKQTAAIVLAAGGSTRLGTPKQLIPWQEMTLLNFTIVTIKKSEIEEVVIVLGANADMIKTSLKDTQLRIVVNAGWQTGKASSIRAGLSAVSDAAKGVMIFLCDQPYLSAELIHRIIQAGEESEAKIIAPTVGEQLSNPVLFKKEIFSAFYTLQGEEGGKNLFSRYPMQKVPWEDKRILLDIDTQDDLGKLA